MNPQPRILLIEDDKFLRRACEVGLKKRGFAVTTANDGEEGLQKARTESFDLILMDMEMPEMDGLEASRTIRANESAQGARRIPIIAMTANAMSEDKARCLASGMDDYLAKPVAMDALKQVIARWLDVSGA